MGGETGKGEGDMWTTACRKRIHGFIDSTAAYINYIDCRLPFISNLG